MANMNISEKCMLCGEIVQDDAVYVSMCTLARPRPNHHSFNWRIPAGKARVQFHSSGVKGVFHVECWDKVNQGRTLI